MAERSDSSSLQLTERGTGCADLIVTPSRWTAWRGRLPALLDAIDAGFAAAEQDGLAPVGLRVGLLRTQSLNAAAELVDLRHPRVVALPIDGNDAAFGPD